MDWNLALTLILGSSLIATLVTKVFDFISEKEKRKELQHQNLYGPFKFYLMLIDISKENRQQIMEHFKSTIKSWSADKTPTDRGEIIMNVMKKQSTITNPLIKRWWVYVDKLRDLLEENPEYIREEDLSIFRKFIDCCIKREIVGKDNAGDDTLGYIPEEQVKSYVDGILEVIEEMKIKFSI